MLIDPFPNPEICPTDSAGNLINGGRFGCSRNNNTRMHRGIDLRAKVGTPFKSLLNGKITLIEKGETGLGLYIIIRSNSVSILYAHLNFIEPSLSVGSPINQGDLLGKTGRSGAAHNVPNAHLHIEVSTDHFMTKNNHVDPEQYISRNFGFNPNPVNCDNV